MAYWKKFTLSAFGLLVGFYVLFQIGYYPTSAPGFCASCHELTPYVQSWESSVHKSVNCLYCHQPSGELGKFHSKARGLNYVFQHFTGDYTILTSAMVFEQQCVQCHLGDDKRYPDTVRMKNTPLVNHYETIKNGQSCLACHRDIGHAVDIHLTVDLKNTREIK